MGVERRFKVWLRSTGALYAAGALQYLVQPKAVGVSLGNMGDEPLPDSGPPGVYNSLASAYMATIAALSFSAATDPSDKKDLIPPLLVAKAFSSGALLNRYLRTRHRGYAFASALDALLLGVTAGFYASLV